MHVTLRNIKVSFFFVLAAVCGWLLLGNPVPAHAQNTGGGPTNTSYAYVSSFDTSTPPKKVIRIVGTTRNANGSTTKFNCNTTSAYDPYTFLCANGNTLIVDSGNTAKATIATIPISISNKAAEDAYVIANPKKADPNDPANAANANSDSPDPELQCGTKKFSFDWLMCPMTKSITFIVNQLDNLVLNMLNVNVDDIFNAGKDPGHGYYAAWQSFRGISLGVLFVAALSMIIAQGLGFEVLDAYTIKKILPRLIIAIIGISLSWELMHFFISFTNDVGIGIRHIIYYPFRTLTADSGAIKLDTTASIATLLLAGGAIAALGIVGLLSLAISALLAVGVAFLVLVIRQLVIVILILLAPVAIACYILPNTQGVWKIWHESFTKAMLMFPIIMAFLAVGRVFAIVSMSDTATGGAPTAVNQLIGLAAYFMPYFLIPLTFRFAGGALRTIGGAVNDRSRGGFDGLKNFRKNRTKENLGAYKQGFDRTALGASMKAGRQRQLTNRAAWGSGAVGVGGVGTSRYRNELKSAEFGHLAAGAAESIKNNPSAAANDDGNKIAQSAKSKNDFIQSYMTSIPGATRETAVNQLASLEQAYGTAMGTQQMQHTAATAALASNASTDSVAERAQWMRDAVSNHVMTNAQSASLVKQSGSLASSAGFGDLIGAADGTVSDAQLLERATKGFNPANSHRMRKGQAQEMAVEVHRQAQAAAAGPGGVNSDAFAKVIADAAGMHDVMNGMTPDVREEFANYLNGAQVAGVRIRDHETRMEGNLAAGIVPNAAYLDRRKTWSATAAGAGGGTPGGVPGGGGPGGGPGGAGGGPGGPGGGGAPSDIRLKRNIAPIFITESNIQLYRFQYLWSDQEYVGVMAQDLLSTHPEALSKDPNGYYRVDYSKLGLQMMTIEEWQLQQSNLVLK